MKVCGFNERVLLHSGMRTTHANRSLQLQRIDFLQRAIEVDRELLQYDYQYGFSSIPNQKNSAAMGVGKVDGRDALISAKHPGQLYLELREKGSDGIGRIVETRDLRRGPSVVTDELGTIKVFRRKNKVDWKPKLSQLLEFLRARHSENVRIRHHYPE